MAATTKVAAVVEAMKMEKEAAAAVIKIFSYSRILGYEVID